MAKMSIHPERGDLDKMVKKPASVQRELAEARRVLGRVMIPLAAGDVTIADVDAVAVFAHAMVDKLALSSARGREGWQRCSVDVLWQMLRVLVEKGDPVDVANLAMMIWHNAKRAA
jgi:hypothetical protein